MLLVLLVLLGCGALTSPRQRRRVVAWLRNRRTQRHARRRAVYIGEYCAQIARRLHAGETLLQAMTANHNGGGDNGGGAIGGASGGAIGGASGGAIGGASGGVIGGASSRGDSAQVLDAPIRQLLHEHNRGATLARATARWAQRDGTEETALLSTAVGLASQQLGANPALFDHVALTLSSRAELVAQAHVHVAQARASIWVVAALPWAIAVVLLAERGAAAQVLLGTRLGWFCIGAAVTLELAGIGWMRWLINRAVP